MSRLALLAALALPAAALATTVLPVPRAELLARADTVVRARVGAQTALRSERSGRILTRSRLAVLETFKGAARPELELEQIGGALEGARLVVPGDARLAPGEEVVVFLRCAERCRLLGLGLGKYAIRRTPEGLRLAVRDAPGLVDPQGAPLPPDTLPLEDLERELRRKP